MAALAAAPALGADEFRELEAAVALPLRDLALPWAAVRFRAFCPLPAPPPGAPPHRLLRGIAIRLPATKDAPPRIEALCLTCPHETCEVDLRSDTANVRLDEDAETSGDGEPGDRAVLPDHPVFVCSCHFSVFDPVREGERLAGPAPRGLYRFHSRVEADRLAIFEVEAAALRAPSSAPKSSN